MRNLALDDGIGQSANPIDGNVDDVFFGERKATVGNDSGSGQHERAVGQVIVADEPLDQVLEIAGHLRDTRFARENRFVVSNDLEVNSDLVARWHGVGQSDPRSDAATLIVDFGLGQIERIVPFDIAAAHVVADRVPDDLALVGKD